MRPNDNGRASGFGPRASRRLCVILVITVLLLAAGPATAKDLDARAAAIAARLRCPVCQNESVADSPAELAAFPSVTLPLPLAVLDAPMAMLLTLVAADR